MTRVTAAVAMTVTGRFDESDIAVAAGVPGTLLWTQTGEKSLFLDPVPDPHPLRELA